VEHVQLVVLAFGEAKVVERDLAFQCRVHAPQVDGEFAVNKDPDVVVAAKVEGFATFECKDEDNLCRKVHVVVVRALFFVVASNSIEWKELV